MRIARISLLHVIICRRLHHCQLLISNFVVFVTAFALVELHVAFRMMFVQFGEVGTPLGLLLAGHLKSQSNTRPAHTEKMQILSL